MKQLILVITILSGTIAQAEQCLSKNRYSEFYCSEITSEAMCGKSSDCRWGTEDSSKKRRPSSFTEYLQKQNVKSADNSNRDGVIHEE